MRTNTPATNPHRTHEGAQALPREAPLDELRRAVLSCLLFEGTFYEAGGSIAERIDALSRACPAEHVADLAIEARQRHGLRHVSLWLSLSLLGRPGAARVIAQTIQRPDELAETLALYWRAGRRPLAAALKRGLREAFGRFDAERLAKYDRDDAVKLRDAMFLVHPRPKDEAQAAAFKALAGRTLSAPDTWEVALSAGADKRATWERLIAEKKLGALALIRNLRGMDEARVPRPLVREALAAASPRGVFPWQIVGAAIAAPWAEPDLEALMFRACSDRPRLAGTTALVVDTSPSMWQERLSARGARTRFDGAAALAMIAREACESVNVYAFNEAGHRVPPRRGFALRDALKATQGSWSRGALAVELANQDGYDRLIVLTDGQWHAATSMTSGEAITMAPEPIGRWAYLVNVAPYQPALMASGKWQRVDGWSDRLLDWIAAVETDGSPKETE